MAKTYELQCFKILIGILPMLITGFILLLSLHTVPMGGSLDLLWKFSSLPWFTIWFFLTFPLKSPTSCTLFINWMTWTDILVLPSMMSCSKSFSLVCVQLVFLSLNNKCAQFGSYILIYSSQYFFIFYQFGPVYIFQLFSSTTFLNFSGIFYPSFFIFHVSDSNHCSRD